LIVNPKIAIEKGWITGNILHDQVQPNGIDLTLGDVLRVSDTIPAYMMRDGTRKILDRRSIMPADIDAIIPLTAPHYYELISNESVNIPQDIACLIKLRSTLVRSGLIESSGLFDSGFKNRVAIHAHQVAGQLKVQKGIRFAQIIFVEAQSASMYSGIYNMIEVLEGTVDVITKEAKHAQV
jgi:deoxycytidine triphosphate deaminase